MKTIQQLLADKPIALAHIEALVALHDVWIVGGAARALLYDLPFPTDIDVLLNNETSTPVAVQPDESYGQDQQKQVVGEVNFDVFHNGLVKWLAGGPCAGDGLAVRAKDGLVLQTYEFENVGWDKVNTRYTGRNREYLEKHQRSLVRDFLALRDKLFPAKAPTEAAA